MSSLGCDFSGEYVRGGLEEGIWDHKRCHTASTAIMSVATGRAVVAFTYRMPTRQPACTTNLVWRVSASAVAFARIQREDLAARVGCVLIAKVRPSKAFHVHGSRMFQNVLRLLRALLVLYYLSTQSLGSLMVRCIHTDSASDHGVWLCVAWVHAVVRFLRAYSAIVVRCHAKNKCTSPPRQCRSIEWDPALSCSAT